MRKTKIFFINGFILTITSFIMKSIGMVFNIYVSNKIGAEALGVFTLVMSVYLFVVTIATSGLSLACTCIVSEQFAKNNFLNGFKAVKSCLFFGFLLGIIASFFVIIFSDTISNAFLKSMVSSVPLYLVAIGLPFISVSSVINGYFSAVRKGYESAIANGLELLIKIFVTIIFLNVYASYNIESVCICLILADVISEICSCILLIVLFKLDKFKFIKSPINIITYKKRIFKITFPVAITNCIRSGLSTLKQFIIPSRLVLFGLSYNIALSEYGKIHGMTMSVLMFPTVFFASFSNLLIPEFASLSSQQYKKRILYIIKRIFFTTSVFSIFIFLIFYFCADEICFKVFHNLECAKYIKILSPLVIFMYLDNVIDSMLKGLNKQVNVMFCNILDLLLTISLLYFLLPTFGLNGYLLSIIISEIFNFSVSFFQLYKEVIIK